MTRRMVARLGLLGFVAMLLVSVDPRWPHAMNPYVAGGSAGVCLFVALSPWRKP